MPSDYLRPSQATWIKNLKAMASRSQRQNELLSAAELMEAAVPILLDTKEKVLYDPLDVATRETQSRALAIDSPSNRHILKALCALLHVTYLMGSNHAWRYFISEKTLIEFRPFVMLLCSTRCFREGQTPSITAEFMVPWWIATALLSGFTTQFERDEESLYTQEFIQKALDDCLQYTWSPSLILSCNAFLKQIGSKLTAEQIIKILRLNKSSFMCFALKTAPAIRYDDLEAQVNRSKTQTMALLEAASAAQPIYKMHADLHALHMDFQLLCSCYRSIFIAHRCQGKPAQPTDDYLQSWWEATNVYISLLKKAIKEAKEATEGTEPYYIADLSHLLLVSKLFGMAKDVSYSKIEKVSDDMKFALEACHEYIPKVLKKELQSEDEIAVDILLFVLQKAGGKERKISCLTPGFRELFTSETLTDRLVTQQSKTCAYCGTEGFDLLKCSSVSY